MQDIKTIFYFAPSLTEYQSRWAAGEISPRTIVFIPPTAEGDSGLIYKGNVLYGKSTDANVREVVRQMLAEDPDILPVATKYNLGGIIVGDFLKVSSNGKVDVDTQTFFSNQGVIEYIKYIINESYIKGIMTSDYIKSILNLNLNNAQILPATTESLGGIIVGSYLNVRPDGTLSVDYKYLLNTLSSDPIAIAAFKGNSIPIATATNRGGIKIGAGFSMSGSDFDVLNINDNYIRSLAGEGASTGGGTQRTFFTNVPANTLPDVPTTDDYQYAYDRFKVGDVLWTSTNVNPADSEETYAIWAWIRNGVCVSIDGPIKISSLGGSNGEDSEEIEWIYTRSQTEWTSDEISRIGSYLEDYEATDKVANTVNIGGIVWSNHPRGIDTTYKYEYASFRPSRNLNGRRIWGQVGFSSPLLWAAYGKQGPDGDGVEYIYYVGAFPPSGTTYDPTTWTANPEPEYRGPEGTPWQDDPINLTVQGQKEWVSIRKKRNGEWGTFSTPALWAYFALDGVVDGYTVDLINENMPVGTDNLGTVTSYTNKCKVQVFHNATQLTYTSAAGSPENGYFKVSYGTIVRSDTNSTDSGISVSSITLDSDNAHDAVITVSMANVSSFEAVNAYIPITVELPDGSTRELVATLYGVSFGEAGASYDMWTSVQSIHSNHNGTSVNPSVINVGLQVAIGNNQYELQKLGQDTVNSNFSFQYAIDDSAIFTPMDATTRPTIIVPTGIHTGITVQMKYGNQVVDSDTIWYVRDGEPGIPGLTPDVYEISIVQSNVLVDSDNKYRGLLKFSITHNGESITTIPEDWTLSVKIGDQSTTGVLNVSTGYWEAEITTSQNYISGTTPPYSSVTLKNDVNTVMASKVAPFIIIGPKGEGLPGQSSYKSTMFVRMNSTPNVPTGGSYLNPSPGGCLAGRNDNGVDQYWTDGIPDGEEILWASTRIFTTDELAPQQVGWQPARKMTDTTDYDVEFAFLQDGNVTPVEPDPGVNTHEHTSQQIWFDPDLDKNSLPAGKTWSDMVWRAERQKRNGQYVGNWVISRIKGENGLITTVVTTQPLEYPIIRIRGEWSSSPSIPYNDGSAEHAENSTRYIDVVTYSGLYFKCINYGTTVRPCDVNLVTTSDWQRFAIAEDTAFNTLIANNAYINSLTSKQVVVTNSSNVPVGGMVSGTNIPTQLGERTNNHGIRIFAGPVSSTGDIYTAPFTVDNNGHVKATSVDLLGNVLGDLSGTFVTTGEGYKVLQITSNGVGALRIYHPDNTTHPTEEIALCATLSNGASLNLYSSDYKPSLSGPTLSIGSHCELDPNSIKFHNYRTNGQDHVGISIDSNLNNPMISISGEYNSSINTGSISADQIYFPNATVTANNISVDANGHIFIGTVDLLGAINLINDRLTNLENRL